MQYMSYNFRRLHYKLERDHDQAKIVDIYSCFNVLFFSVFLNVISDLFYLIDGDPK